MDCINENMCIQMMIQHGIGKSPNSVFLLNREIPKLYVSVDMFLQHPTTQSSTPTFDLTWFNVHQVHVVLGS